MRNDRFAEIVLSLAASPERAASAVGDLIEEGESRGRLWFWWSLTRLVLSCVGRDLLFAPIRMAVSSAIAWFFYMGLSLVVAIAGYVVVTLAWGLAYVLTHHTGAELLTDILLVRFDWPPIPMWAAVAIQAVAFFAVAPFQIGYKSAPYWRGHELSLILVMLPIWLAMATYVPFVGIGVRAMPTMMPLVVMFVLLGAIWSRSTSPPRTPLHQAQTTARAAGSHGA